VPPRVAVTRRILPAVRDSLAESFEIAEIATDRPPAVAELHVLAAGADGLLVLPSDRIDEALLAAAGPGLRVVATASVGLDHVDVPALTARGVLVANTPGATTAPTAELALTLLLTLLRRVAEGDRLVRARTPWALAPTFMLGRGLRSIRLGLVGRGAIGSEVERLARAFGADVVHTTRSGAGLPGWLPLEELLATSDAVSLHCPLGPETRHLIDAAALARMKPGAVLVNTSRGPVVDEAALVAALASGRLGGAALDVYEREPEVSEGLLACENVVLAPHLGSSTVEARLEMGELCVAALRAVLLEGRIPANAVNPEAFR
jgi:glyoxylate reductase